MIRKLTCLTILISLATVSQAQFSKTIRDISANGKVVESEIHWYRYHPESQSISKIRETYALFDEAGRQLEDKTNDLVSGRITNNTYTWKEDGKPSEMLVEVRHGQGGNEYFAKFIHLLNEGRWQTYEVTGRDTVTMYLYEKGTPTRPEILEVYDYTTNVLKQKQYHSYYNQTQIVESIRINHFEGDQVVASETVTFDERGYRSSYELKGQRKEVLERDAHNAIVKTQMIVDGQTYLTSESVYAYDGEDNWTKVYRKRYGQNGEVVEEMYGFKKTKKWYKDAKGAVVPDEQFVTQTNPLKK